MNGGRGGGNDIFFFCKLQTHRILRSAEISRPIPRIRFAHPPLTPPPSQFAHSLSCHPSRFFPVLLLLPSDPCSLPSLSLVFSLSPSLSFFPSLPSHHHRCVMHTNYSASLSGLCPAFACLACIGGNQRSQRQAEIHAAKRGDSAASRASHEWRQCNEGKKVHTTQQTSQKPPPPLRVTRCFTAVALLGPRSAFRARLSEGRPPPLLGFQSRAPCCSLGVPNHRVRSSRGAALQ